MAVHCAKNDFWTAKIAFYFFCKDFNRKSGYTSIHILYFGVN